MKKSIIFISLISMLLFTACDLFIDTQSTKETQKVNQQQEQYSIGQPVPAFDWSFERDLVIQLYRLRNQKVATYTVWRSDYGLIEGDCSSIGYGIPYETSLTNPLVSTNDNQRGRRMSSLTSIEQAEPNGVFASKNTNATWVMSIDPATSQIAPLYIESKVTVYPYPIIVNYETNRVHKSGEVTTSINITK